MDNNASSYEFFNHTADVGLTARGRSLPGLFDAAGRGLMALLVDPATAHPGGIRERIRAEAPDRETLLVNWLNQILFLFSVQQMVFCRFHIRTLTDTFIEAEGEGELFDPGRHAVLREVKAATFRELDIKESSGIWQTKVVFDV